MTTKTHNEIAQPGDGQLPTPTFAEGVESEIAAITGEAKVGEMPFYAHPKTKPTADKDEVKS